MPILPSLAGCLPVTSTPRKRTLPADGRNVPLITLKSVVFPAPLGPMKPQMCFSGTSKLTSFKAATPPKYFVSPWTSRIFTPSPKQFCQLMQQSDQTVRLEQDDHDQQRTIQQKMQLRKLDDQLFLNNTEHRASQHRSPNGSDAADHRHEQNGNSSLESKDSSRTAAGIYIYVVARMQGPGNACKRRGNCVCPQLESIGIHSQLSGCFLILFDGSQCQAKSALGNPC